MASSYDLLRPLLFRMDPERSHDLVMANLGRIGRHPALLSLIEKQFGNRVADLPVHLMGIDFPNPVGLAAGLDKQGDCANAFHAMGFGWVELGTVTPLPQPGNDKPRMFRLVDQQAIINRMGFNSCGLDTFLGNVGKTSPGIVKGINIGKNAVTPIDKAADDYLACMDAVYLQADYITVNISSPNTQNLRQLQNDESLDALLAAIDDKRQKLAARHSKTVPLVLKIAPDLDQTQVQLIAELLKKHHIDAVAATNTTIDKRAVENSQHGNETGGLSGAPVRQRSTEIIAELYRVLQGSVPIIGMGGIDTASAAIEKLQAGASLLQLYTGFIYKGPALINEIVSTLKTQCGEQSYSRWLQDQHSKIVLPAGV